MTHLAGEDAPLTEPAGSWLPLSAALTECVADLADREDLMVTIAPGAGDGSPGCYFPTRAAIELDGALLDVPPETCDPGRPSDRERYPALWGVFVHEVGHGDHSRWRIPGSAAPMAALAALTLEESRMEAAHLARRPGDRRWLRAATRELILPEIKDAAMTASEAAQAAALVLARVDAGVLDEDEAAPVANIVEKILGADRLEELRGIWRAAQATSDEDAEAMLALGHDWCRAIGIDPAAKGPGPAQQENPSTEPSPLAEAIETALAAVAASDGVSASAGDPERNAAREEERVVRQRAAKAAQAVFASGRYRDQPAGPHIRAIRPPTIEEQAAARRLARALRAAAHRERVAVVSTSPAPPGRLRMRGALAADAQRAAGATPTAELFTRTIRRHVPTPPLRLGIACDVSGSMANLAKPVASAAWILARAASHVSEARSATVTFGNRVLPVTRPGTAPRSVLEFGANDLTEEFGEAIDALDGILDLSRPGAARLLVVVSDGAYRPSQLAGGQDRITRLIKAGCGVVWLALGRATPMMGVQAVVLAVPSDAADAIGRAAVRALGAAR